MPDQRPILAALGDGHERPEPFCGDIDMRIDRHGMWHYGGSPIGRMELVKLFASVLRRDDDGDYWLETPVEKARIQVEDAPFVAVAMSREKDIDGKETVSVSTNLDETVTIDSDHPLSVRQDNDNNEPRPYVTIRPGLDALVARSVYYEMVDQGTVETIGEESHVGLWSKNQFFSLGILPATD